MKVYVASSWRNEEQPRIVRLLREEGHEVYDFRHPQGVRRGFRWSDIDPGWRGWTPRRFRASLDHRVAKEGFDRDWAAMQWADAFVLVMPCGRSAHLELGWAVGAGKPALVLLSDGEPELMYRMATVCVSFGEVAMRLADLEDQKMEDANGEG